MTAMIARRQPMPTFTGGEELLDALIVASSAHKMPAAGSTLPVATRTLVPYFPANVGTGPKPARPSGKRVGTGCSSPPKNRPSKEKKSRANSPANATRPKPAQGPPSRPASPATGMPRSTKNAHWAGPGYVVSPKPDALPIPPMSLLQRA